VRGGGRVYEREAAAAALTGMPPTKREEAADAGVMEARGAARLDGARRQRGTVPIGETRADDTVAVSGAEPHVMIDGGSTNPRGSCQWERMSVSAMLCGAAKKAGKTALMPARYGDGRFRKLLRNAVPGAPRGRF